MGMGHIQLRSKAGNPASSARGMTLLELLIVIAVVCVIFFIAWPTLKPSQLEADAQFAKEQLQYLYAKEQEYFARHGEYVPFSTIAADEELGGNFDSRFHTDMALVNDITFEGPRASGTLLGISAVMPDGSRYTIDQNGQIGFMPVQQ